MADTIDQIASRLNILIKDTKTALASRLQASDSSERPDPERTLSNTSLLLDTLTIFYSDPKAQFFPTVITTALRDQLIQTEGLFAGLPTEDQPIPADSASGLLKQLEDLFAYCLQYGLITYGFPGKVAQEQVELIRRARQQTEAAAKKMLASVNEGESNLASRLNEFGESLVQAEANFKAMASERLEILQPSIDGLASLLEEGRANSTEIQRIVSSAAENSAAIEKVRDETVVAVAAINTELNNGKIAADAELTTIQNRGAQVQNFESEAKVMHQSITDARAKMTDQMAQITAFYGEIETYRLQMTDAGKAAQSNLADLRALSEMLVSDLRTRTEEVVSENESLIGQIKDHLRKAIGASLFTAFDTRRRQITKASWVWAILLLVSVTGTIWFAFWFVSEIAKLADASAAAKLNNGPPSGIQWTLLYARLVIVAPLAFLITFTAKRYTSERRAEEEWAFKSAISISLDPFRDLIARMAKDGHQTAFVERLVAEIFDNPTKRLYALTPDKEDKEGPNILGLAREVLDKIPKAN